MPTVNGHEAEAGCYVDGHWGQYGPDHLADQAAAFGWEPESWADDPRVIRQVADTLTNMGYHDAADAVASLAIEQGGATDAIEEWLNEHTPDPVYVWHWRDGEFFLSPICEDGDCTDDTCAHWD